MNTVIRTWALSKDYHGRPALTELDQQVPANVVFGYLGPNGAGKPRRSGCWLGLLRPSGGRAQVLGFDTVCEREQAQRHVGYLPGEFVAYPT